MRKDLNVEEVARLAPYEKQMKTAVEARWVSHIPQNGIDVFLEVWKSLTGSERVYRMGCGTCILNLVSDLGVLYFRYKKNEAEKAQESVKSVGVEKSPAGEKKPRKAKNSKQE